MTQRTPVALMPALTYEIADYSDHGVVFETASLARTVDRLIAGRLQDLEILKSLASELKSTNPGDPSYRSLMALARSAREAMSDLQKSRDVLVNRHLQASGGKIVAAVDSATRLANHGAFTQRLSDTLANLAPARTVSLMIVEVGALYLLASEAGPDVANKVVRRLSAILRRTLKRSDFIARISPHEFAVIFEDLLPEQVVPIALRVHDAIRAKLSPAKGTIADVLSINMGIAGTSGREKFDNVSAEYLVSIAQSAVVDARRQERPAIFVA
jgi:diguanylate cyclase (GGDEF)-like protein